MVKISNLLLKLMAFPFANVSIRQVNSDQVLLVVSLILFCCHSELKLQLLSCQSTETQNDLIRDFSVC